MSDFFSSNVLRFAFVGGVPLSDFFSSNFHVFFCGCDFLSLFGYTQREQIDGNRKQKKKNETENKETKNKNIVEKKPDRRTTC